VVTIYRKFAYFPESTLFFSDFSNESYYYHAPPSPKKLYPQRKLLSLPLCGHLSMFIYVKGA
jgi:hypothetical protein